MNKTTTPSTVCCSVLPPHLNFTRKATVCLHSFIPFCADHVAVGMVIIMEHSGKSYIIKIDGSHIYIIDALTNEIIQKFEVIDNFVRGIEDDQKFSGITSENENLYIWNANVMEDGILRICIYSEAGFNIHTNDEVKAAQFIEELNEYLANIIIEECESVYLSIESM